jgi:hypothetical protein
MTSAVPLDVCSAALSCILYGIVHHGTQVSPDKIPAAMDLSRLNRIQRPSGGRVGTSLLRACVPACIHPCVSQSTSYFCKTCSQELAGTLLHVFNDFRFGTLLAVAACAPRSTPIYVDTSTKPSSLRPLYPVFNVAVDVEHESSRGLFGPPGTSPAGGR